MGRQTQYTPQEKTRAEKYGNLNNMKRVESDKKIEGVRPPLGSKGNKKSKKAIILNVDKKQRIKSGRSYKKRNMKSTQIKSNNNTDASHVSSDEN